MAKEKKYNPVQAQHKADKAKAVKKGKAEQQARRNEKLAQRNPARIEQQIKDLKAIKEGGGKPTALEEQSLEALEKDLKAVKKAREALGDRAPQFGRGGPSRPGQRSDGVLGKRRRDDEDASSDDSDIPDDVKRIPMPRDTPPPIPKEIMDEWYAKRRAKRDANHEPVAERTQPEKPATPAPVVESKTVYEAKPVIRDLRKEAVSAFVPTHVRMKIEKGKGQGGLLEPEEADKLEREGYLRGPETQQYGSSTTPHGNPHGVTLEEVEDEGN
ncbi:WW domain binding protein 11-domain-containing protein [Triangularia verruculosa]|uniref:WW domain binding protein 11-domain-containing protein n=1 Tax=Triangularia verruculosa TaxID=2587418 RepID=A0AAN6XDU0_9PEZI|nr:WW domain binding protein 11-domain-containing protein [Triangularia verruculosa]